MYHLTITKKQAEIISEALEVFARLGMGQVEAAIRYAPGCDVLGYFDIEEVVKQLPIAKGKKTNFSDTAWDIHQVLRHRLAWEHAVTEGYVETLTSQRNWDEMLGVHYDEPMKRGDEPLATIEEATVANGEKLA